MTNIRKTAEDEIVRLERAVECNWIFITNRQRSYLYDRMWDNEFYTIRDHQSGDLGRGSYLLGVI